MNARDQMLLEYGELPDGLTRAGELCPVCEGGGTGERTLSVTKEAGRLLWYCHRASCGFAGSSEAHSRNVPTTTTPVSCRGVVGRAILRGSRQLPENIRGLLKDRYCITDTHIARWQIGWDEETERLAIPVLGSFQEPLGVVLRALDGKQPKTKTHAEQGAMSWHINHTAAGVIIVEDQFSSIRASDYLTSVALLGTNLNETRAESIRTTGLRPVYIGLDPDAWALTIKYSRQYRGLLRPIPLRLPKDLKDMSDAELKVFMNENIFTG